MKRKIIKKEDFITTKWAGGETTQLAIYPEDSVFAKKDFLFRVSSATFTSSESTFSDFSGYQRYILPLEGKIKLYHKGLYNRDLDKYDVEYFDGSWDTFSENTLDCRDYNFIVKGGSAAKMQVLHKGEEYNLKESQIVTIFSVKDYMLEFNNDDKRHIDGFSLLVLETDKQEKIKILDAETPILITEFTTK